MTGAVSHQAAAASKVLSTLEESASFLQTGNGWFDAVWCFKPTSILEEANPIILHWDFAVGNDHFTDDRCATLLQSCRQLIACIRMHSLSKGMGQKGFTVRCYFSYLRILVRWMYSQGIQRFAELDATALMHFQRSITERPGIKKGSLIAPTTVQKYLYLFVYLYRFRNDLDDALNIDPFPGLSLGVVSKVRESDIPRLPYTPDHVAVPLVQGAIEVLAQASQVLRARDVYAEAIDRAQKSGMKRATWPQWAKRALRDWQYDQLDNGTTAISTPSDLALSIDLLYAACFVVIAYLVGPRASEILHLQAGCVRSANGASNGDIDAVTTIVGTIFKKEAEYHGRRHEWVAPPAAVRAVQTLELLSAPHRVRSGRTELWLRRHESGIGEWWYDFSGPLQIPTSSRICHLLGRLATWLRLPEHEGKPWHLTTHQGRKTLARFVALRDRSALFALAQHLGHRDRSVTDSCYAGSDYRLNCEIDAGILEQSVAAWEHMLAAPSLGGRAGAEIMAKRPRFQGIRLKQDIKSYARMLVESGLTLGVCDWGFCVYRQEHSACLGNALGPHPARREPSTCSRCKNFVVSLQHRSYWAEQILRNNALLNEPGLPYQTLRIVRERLEEAHSLLRSIDAGEEGSYGPRSTC